MRLLQRSDDGSYSLTRFFRDYIPRYAILSHTWGADVDEVSFKDLTEDKDKKKKGWRKLQFCSDQAAKDGLGYFWVDTCCIDQTSSAELSEAINSMFAYYSKAAACYVYLSDVSAHGFTEGDGAFQRSRWFSRGWTLQELIAPGSVEFFSVEGQRLGDKRSMVEELHKITQISVEALQDCSRRCLDGIEVSERMAWMKQRQTKLEEDEAYSLLGIFGVYMPLIYGEGRESAFARLVRKIERGSEKQKRKLKPFSTVPFTPDQEFVDRQELLSWIHDRCAQPGGRLALVGLGGIGKSQLAIQYAHNVRAASPNQFVFWVYAGTRARFEQAYRDVAEKLQLPGWDDTKTDVLKLVSDWLCDETNGNWTMVLDNVDSMDTFFSIDSDKPDSRTPVSLSTYLPQSSNGSILITSQNKDVAARLTGGYNHIREVHAMAKHESLELLRKKLRDETSAVGASELLDALGHMPLAISQAAAYINRRAHMTAERYLRELSVSNEKRERLLNWNAGDLRRDQSASSSVVAIFQLSYERIQQERPSAADLLSLMSFFNPQSIPEPVLRRYMTRNLSAENQIEANDAFEADVDLLQAYSLVEVTAKTEAYEIHALVQTCMQLWLTSVGDAMKWECAFVDLMAQEFPCGTYGSWSQCQLLLPHIERLFESRPMDDAIVLSWAQLLTNAAYYLWAHGKYPTAQQVARKAIIAQERVSGCDDEATMVAVNTLALVLKAQAKYKEAEVLQQRVLTVRNKVLGQNHPLTLDSVSNLAILLQDQGRYGEAESLFRRALSGKRIALGEQHLDTLLSMNCLAAGLQNRARYDEEQVLHQGKEIIEAQRHEAELLFKKALEGREKELGEHHPYTLMSVSNLACALMDQGKFSEAEVLNRQVLEARKMVLGVDHPDTLTSVSNLAQVLQAQEKYDEAEALNRQAFEERREQLGEQHPDTLTSAHNLGELLAERKRYKEAADCLQRAYDGLEQSLGPQHPWTVICRTTLLDVQCMAERVPRPKRSIFAYLKAQFSRNGISRVESR